MNLFSRSASIPAVAVRLRRKYCVDDPRLQVEKFSLRFPNPVGLAAGFDKDGRWFRQLATLGFGGIEIGTVTGQAQPGNPKPRLFRLPDDNALINRMGFNSPGCESVAEALNAYQDLSEFESVLGVNIGKSKVVPLEYAPAEYQKSFERLFRFADYFTINVSSPNTPGLRELQGREHLVAILKAVDEVNSRLAEQRRVNTKPVLLKIAPDLTEEQLGEVVDVAREQRLSGLIATNTTVSRAGLKTSAAKVEAIGAGGLSGRPLRSRSLEVVRFLYQKLKGEIPIVGVGGITSGEDAWNMISAGADLVQLYTGFIYRGPGIVRSINEYLLQQLEQNKLEHISDAVGTHSVQVSDG